VDIFSVVFILLLLFFEVHFSQPTSCSMLGYWHDTVVSLSVRPSVTLCIVTLSVGVGCLKLYSLVPSRALPIYTLLTWDGLTSKTEEGLPPKHSERLKICQASTADFWHQKQTSVRNYK